MTTVIYKPPTQSPGNAIGEGLGLYASYEIQKNLNQQYVQRLQEADKQIQAAPNRAAALDILNKIPFRNIREFQAGKDFVDQSHPVTMEQPKKVETWDATTGAPKISYVRAGDEAKTSNPEFLASLTGSPNQTLAQPVSKDYYKVDGTGTAAVVKPLGHFAEGHQPPGSVSMDELTVMTKMQSDARATERAQKEDIKFNAMLLKMGDAGDAKRMAEMKAYNGVLSMATNVKKTLGPDGVSFTLDFGGDSKKADAYRTALEKGDEYLKKYKGDINKSAMAALRDAGYFDKPTEAPVAAPPVEAQSGLSKAWDFVSGKPKQPPSKAPAAQKAATSEAKPSAKGIPDGAKLIGKTPAGKDVYQTPDGKKWVE